MAMASFVASPAGPRLIPRHGSRVVTPGGPVRATGVLVPAITVRRERSGLGAPGLLPGVAIAGSGQGLPLSALFRIVLFDVPAARAGVGGGVTATTQQAALAPGVATLGTVPRPGPGPWGCGTRRPWRCWCSRARWR
ncbi:hypothetical protein ACFVH0_04000 [Streptomyces sp. NPDC127117]|uniref:hypothetical protein n=1 Tax=Streptomyces sp. NPDC127117 TaxID=3345368 RepID=UPI0036309432